MENITEISKKKKKTEKELLHQAVPLLGVYVKKNKTLTGKDTRTTIFNAGLLHNQKMADLSSSMDE